MEDFTERTYKAIEISSHFAVELSCDFSSEIFARSHINRNFWQQDNIFTIQVMLRVCGAVLFLVGVSICQSCSLSSANGIYDLSPLAYSSSQGSWPSGYDWSNNEAAYTYFINFCEQVSTAISPACFGAGTCQLSGSSNYFNLGVASTATLTEGVNVFHFSQLNKLTKDLQELYLMTQSKQE
jgi:hypothetical protein